MVLKSVHSKMMLGSVLAILFVAANPVHASTSADDLRDFTGWIAQTRSDAELAAQMQRPTSKNSPLDSAGAQALAEAIRHSIVERASIEISDLLQGSCQPSEKADFLDAGDPAFSGALTDGASKDFESGIIRVEAVGCLDHGTAAEALKTYFDPSFRKQAVAHLTDSSMISGLLCEQTEKIPMVVDSTRSCVSLTPHDSGSIHTVLVSLVSNVDGFAPIYHREGIVTAIDTPQGPRMHVLLFARQQKFSSMVHGMARSQLQSAQKNAFEELNQKIAP